ncbi:MAG TPA: class I SAM-dependent rRNA methyltransferase [Edaphocola sp.]|nr:class I SAM-dependent rRNA methyltransferase [Edaphocola sp.]
MSAKIFLRKKIAPRIAQGHPWVFASEIGDVAGFEDDGAIVSVYSSNGSFIGKGYYNPASKISIRLLTRGEQVAIRQDFFLERIRAAIGLRPGYLFHLPFVRLVASEADFLPGLIVDKIQDYIVFQIHTLGMELWKDCIATCLRALFPQCHIYEKNDGRFRMAEHLGTIRQCWFSEFGEQIVIEHSGLLSTVDLASAPRTGLYWEQLLLSRFLAPYVRGRKMLDAFCYHGYLVLSALRDGALVAVGLDWSEQVIDLARQQAEMNGMAGNADFLVANSFLSLSKASLNEQTFDLIILDPPSLNGVGKNEETVLSGYEKLLLNALGVLTNGGLLLLTMSGKLLADEVLMEKINQIAQKQQKRWRIVEFFGQGPDHPVLALVPATRYFKAWLLAFDAGN